MVTEQEKQIHFDYQQWVYQGSEAMKTLIEFTGELFQGLKFLFIKFSKVAYQQTRFFFSRLTRWDYLYCSINTFVSFIATMVFCSGLGLLAYQVFLWIKDGAWTDYSVFVMFNFLLENTALHQWINQPESWLGLQRILFWLFENTPLSLALIVPGIMVAFLSTGVMGMAVLIRYYQFKKTESN
jgi:hypothetical protein